MDAALFLLIWLGLTVVWVLMIVDASRRPSDTYAAVGRLRSATIALVIIAGWFGAIYYLLIIRRDLIHADLSPDPTGSSAPPRSEPTKRCEECGMSSIAVDSTRCTNCGSQRLTPLAG